MLSASKSTLLITMGLTVLSFQSRIASAIELLPFATQNQNPFIQIFGVPTPEPATLLESGQMSASLTENIASHYTKDHNTIESVRIDGETHRTELSWRYGLNEQLEVGVNLPYLKHTAGHLDSFVDQFHKITHLPGGGRFEGPHNDLIFRYTRNGENLVYLDKRSQGVGDLRLSVAWQLPNEPILDASALALRLSLKLPTGESDELLGSGSTDLAVSLNSQWDAPADVTNTMIFATLGTLVMSKGDVIPGQQRKLASFGSLGCTWSPFGWLALKMQFDANTALFKNSELVELEAHSVQYVFGASFEVAQRTILDVSLIEDILVHRSPDAVFHFALRKVF